MPKFSFYPKATLEALSREMRYSDLCGYRMQN